MTDLGKLKLKSCPHCGKVMQFRCVVKDWVWCHEINEDGPMKCIEENRIIYTARGVELWNQRDENQNNEWIETCDRLPEKPGKYDYEQVPCLVYIYRYGISIAQWNCEHLVWDAEDGDDVHPMASKITHWKPLPNPPTKK